ncbi:Doublesex-and mab-3-related transcription factor A2 [Nibea albiflora]|uniref:Doublesex-and mab-3-related transcription factor A2 n=1 Tax=Nibea albiflora TaxID=240163 RepID=A0ACB7ERM9_NIBAL|nr:Doublesex-and mab-3-related transcription factor A2 [Nibea albiflora]
MSLSKAASKQPRELKCTRCRHHGIIVPQKGHTKYCPFLSCDCWKCYLITQRSRIAALQRNLKRAHNEIQSKEQRPCEVSGVKPAAEGTDGGRQLAASGLICPPPSVAGGGGGAGGGRGRSAAISANSSWCSPLDLRSRPAAEGGSLSGYDHGKVPPASSEEGTWTPYNEFAPLPVIHVPFRMSGHCPGSCVPCPHFMPPGPAGLVNLCGPRLFPHFEPAALHYPAPPQPGPRADCRHVFFTLQPPPLPEAFQKESEQPPLSTCSGNEIVELD